jgi:hypothetical protein
MGAPIARPVALSASPWIARRHQPKPPNLPLTITAKWSDK